MGYDYYHEYIQFTSKLNYDRIKEAFKSFIEHAQSNEDLQELCHIQSSLYNLEYWGIHFGHENDDGAFTYCVETDGTRYLEEEALAVFISLVIHEDDQCIMEFKGEDEEQWRFIVTKNKVQQQNAKIVWEDYGRTTELDNTKLMEILL